MPRGVYDRSKTKAAKATTSAAPKAKRAYNRKAVAAAPAGGTVAHAKADHYEHAHKLEALGKHFTNLISAHQQTGFASPELTTQVKNTLQRMEHLAEQIVPLDWTITKKAEDTLSIEDKAEVKVATKAAKAHAAPVAAPAPVAIAVPAPVPFNPPPVANGAQ
jgi:hypothetical protein